MSKMVPLAKGAFLYLGVCAVLGILTFLLNPWASIVPGALFAFVAFFFRDPPREIPRRPDAITAPADGRIVEIDQTYEDRFLNERATRVSIFLSLFDVHLNRSPVGGRVAYLKYEKGRFRPAFVPNAPVENERNFIGIEGDRDKVLVVQIAGVLVRRIKCSVSESEVVQKGQRIGMIILGSRTEIILPLSAEILIKKGEKVKAGETVLARWKKL